jgi:hypothetical protein
MNHRDCQSPEIFFAHRRGIVKFFTSPEVRRSICPEFQWVEGYATGFKNENALKPASFRPFFVQHAPSFSDSIAVFAGRPPQDDEFSADIRARFDLARLMHFICYPVVERPRRPAAS